MVLDLVAVDIETTGFGAHDEVTVIGFAHPVGVRVFVQATQPAASLTDAVDATLPGETPITVSTHANEHALLTAVTEFVTATLTGTDKLLVAYNGERWNGGFDIPFLRTRYAQGDIAWPFVDVPYADLLPLITDRFNTTVDGDDHDTLPAAYALLCDGAYDALDPFADSQTAVTAFENDQLAPLVRHNVADVLRTRALGQLTERYCAKSEFDVKSLTPTRSR